MGCLIRIEFSDKASEKEVVPILFSALYSHFFFKGKIVSEILKGKRKVVEIYVRHPENAVSNFIVNVLSRDSKIKHCEIIS